MIKKTYPSLFQKFIKIEGLGGILLFAATIIAMIWANSPYGDLYQAVWNYKIGPEFKSVSLVKPLILWINDGLMAIFFFLIGLEIKRELLIGELNSLRKATFPLFAAIGGMLVPLTLFLYLIKTQKPLKGGGFPWRQISPFPSLS